jgi:hypothetical protein
MSKYQFVLTETRDGAHDHGNHHRRRRKAWWRAGLYAPPIKPVTDYDHLGDVVEWQSSPGIHSYLWRVNDPSDTNVYNLVRVFEGQRPQCVYCSSPPTPFFTAEEWEKLQNTYVRDIDDSEIK